MILDQLDTLEPLTPAERSLAEFLSFHAAEVPRLSISELAQRTSTSNATVVRFCRRLGFDGFRAFRIQLVSELERGLSKHPVNLNYPVSPFQSTSATLDSIASVSKEAVDATRAALNPHDVQAVARAIRKAPLVLIYASGDTQITAESFANLLIKIGIRCIIAERRREYYANAHAARQGEVALFASYSGAHIGAMRDAGVLGELKARGCTTIGVTASTELQPQIDRIIIFPAREDPQRKIATFYSQACFRYIFNCIYAETWALDYEANTRHKDSIRRAETTARHL